MRKNDLEKRVSKILDEEETFMISLILLAHMHDDEKYKDLSALIYLFDNYNVFKQFIKFYEGKEFSVPTMLELKQALRLLALFQRVKIDKKDFDEAYESLKLKDLNLTKEYCLKEIDKFYEYLQKDGAFTLKQIRKLSKFK